MPTRAVPRFCTRKSPTRMSTVSGTTSRSSALPLTASVESATSESGFASPSTADKTEIAGVMIPSP